MDKVWWFGVAVLALSGLALGVMIVIYIQEGKRLNINVEDRSYNFDDEDWPNYSIPIENYFCCDHCYTMEGERIHKDSEVDNHTVPCNERSLHRDGPCQDGNSWC